MPAEFYGLQTHFNGRPPIERLRQVATRFEVARIDAQDATPETRDGMIADARRCGLRPLVIVQTLEQLEALPDGIDVEWQNEVNIGLGRPAPIPPALYRATVLEAYAITTRKGQRLWAGGAANFEQRDLDWFNALDFKSLPADIGCATHHYTPGTRFVQPHRGFSSRAAEVNWFKAAIGYARAWAITEFGYQTGPGGMSEDEAAREIAKEWAFWKDAGAAFAVLYQISDSAVDDHDFGVFRADGSIKQAIVETVPLRVPAPVFLEGPAEQQESAMGLVVYDALSRKAAIPHPTRPGHFTWPHPDNDGTVLAIAPGPSIQKRPKGSDGAYETGRDDGTTAVFEYVHEGRAYTYAILLVN